MRMLSNHKPYPNPKSILTLILINFNRTVTLNTKVSLTVLQCQELFVLSAVFLNYYRTRVPYGEEKEKFVYPMTLVFIQCIVNALFATLGL